MKFEMNERVRDVKRNVLGRFKGWCVASPAHAHVLLDGRGLTIVIPVADLRREAARDTQHTE